MATLGRQANPIQKEDDAMAKATTPSDGITAGQIGKISDLVGAGLRKSGLKNDPVQRVIENQGDSMVNEIVAVVRKYVDKYVETVSNLITRVVKVDRTRTPQEALDATSRKQYTDRKVVDSMPRGDGEEVEVNFFSLGRYVSDDELEKEYELRGLKPADPYTLAAVNEADPAFADKHPNGTHWQDADGRWCFVSFVRRDDGRRVRVDRDINDRWDAGWWFAGVRK